MIQQVLIPLVMIIMTVGIYLIMSRIYSRFSWPFLLPVLTTTILMVVLLIGVHISYDTYMKGGKWINFLLRPSVVALAYPLYKQRFVLKKYMVPILVGVSVGMMTGMLSGLFFGRFFHFDRSLVLSMLPKSFTMPVAIQITASIGGISSMTIICVMVAGLTGAIVGPVILKWLRIKSVLGKGIALGSASHVLGITKASEFGELAVSIGSVAMILSALLGSIVAPYITMFFHI
jgi:predicted murein hydrolase (TIGR00659 family)